MINDASDPLLVAGLAQFGEQFDSSLTSCSSKAVQLLFSGIPSPFKQENATHISKFKPRYKDLLCSWM